MSDLPAPQIEVFDVTNDCHLALIIRKADQRPDLHLNVSRSQAATWLREIADQIEAGDPSPKSGTDS